MDFVIIRVARIKSRLQRNRAKIAGFAAGVFGTLVMGVFASVLATGHPIDLGAPPPVQVYTNF